MGSKVRRVCSQKQQLHDVCSERLNHTLSKLCLRACWARRLCNGVEKARVLLQYEEGCWLGERKTSPTQLSLSDNGRV